RADLVWRNGPTGTSTVWTMNGTSIGAGSGTTSLQINNSFVLAGVGDFNGDGGEDLLWRDMATGMNSIWLLNGTTVLAGSGTTLPISDLNWSVGGIGDFNHDGRSDILWRTNT